MTFRGHEYQLLPDADYCGDEIPIREKYWRIEQDDVVLDVGAACGAYTFPALACGARVCAVDCNQWGLDVLRATADLNGFTNLTTRCLALFDGTPFPNGLKTNQQQKWPTLSPPLNAVWSTVDEIVTGDLDWMKIDVEGAELGVLRGGLRTLREQHPRLIVEDHSEVYPWVRRRRIAERVTELLRGLGYRVKTVPYGIPKRNYLIAT